MSTLSNRRLLSRRSSDADQGRNRRQFLNQYTKRRPRQLRIESLEDRRVMAFNITLTGSAAVVIGDGNSDTFIVDHNGTNLRHNRAGDAGFNSAIDWDNAVAGDQLLPISAASTISFDMGGGDDVLQLGTAAIPATSLLAAITYNAGGAGNDSLIVDNTAALAVTLNYTSTTVTGGGLNLNNLAVLENGETYRTGAAGSITNIASSLNNLSIVGSAGSSTVNIGSTGTLANITGNIAISNPPSFTAINIDDTARNVAHTVNWTADTITGLTPAGTISYVDGDVSSLTISTGAGIDTFNINDSISNTTNTINGGDANDIFNVAANLLSGSSTVNYNGQNGDDTFAFSGVPLSTVTQNVDGGLQTTADGDVINIVAGTAINTLRHFLDTSSTGRFEYDLDATDNGGLVEAIVNYVGLEPINDNANAVNRVFDFGTGADADVAILDDGTAGNNISRIQAPANAELVNFLSPTGSLTVNLGDGDDILSVNAFDSLFPAIAINLNGGNDLDQVRLGAAPTGSTVNIDTSVGIPDSVTVGRTAAGTAVSLAQFNQTANVTTLAAILAANVNIHDNGVGQVYIDDSGDAVARTFNFNANASIPVFAVPGISVTGGAFPGSINFSNFMEIFQFAAGGGNDILNINATHNNPNSTETSTFFGNAGTDTFNINASALTSSSNVVQGDANDDTFNVNITTAAGITAPLLLQGELNDFGAGVGSRDVVSINDNVGLGFGIQLNYTGLVGGSEAIVTGMGSALTVDTSETIRYSGAGPTDTFTVFGTVTGNDLITVAPISPTRALVFNGGNPFDGPPEVNATSLPGVSGGSTAPDLDLNGLTQANGLTIQDNGATTGDRLYVYGENQAALSDGNTFNPFGFGAGVLLPAVATPGSYDTISATDTFVQVDGFVRVNYDNVDFVQANPVVNPAVVVNAGFETTNSVGTADNITVTPSPAYKFQVNGGDPDPATTGIVPPNGDRLTFGGVIDTVNVWATKTAGQPVISLEFVGSGNLPVSFSSIEDFGPLTATTVNLIGDNNDPAVDQNDDFVVVGRNTDGNNADGGYQEFQLFINNSVVPLNFNGVQFLNVFGDDQNPPPGTPSAGNDIDTLEITPYADDTPRGWGIDVAFNEGNPAGTDGVQDLLILHTSGFGGQVSENIVIKPSGTDDGEVIVTNASFGTPIVDIDFVANTDIIIRDDDGFLNDTDTVTLLGTNPDTAQVSGNETFTVNADAAMDLANPLVTVVDSNTPANVLYRLREYTTSGNPAGFHDNLTINGLAGNDTINLVGGLTTQQNDQYNFLGGEGDDSLNINMPNGFMFDGTGLYFDGGSGADSLSVRNTAALNNAVTSTTYTVGAAVGAGKLTYVDGFSVDMVVDFVNLEPVVDLVASANLIINADNANNAINYSVGSVVANGVVSVDNQETIEFSNKTNLTINALAGSDTINLNNPNTPTGLTGAITVNAGDPTGSDTLIINGRPGLQDQIRLTPTAQGAGTITQTGVPNRVYTGIETVRAVMDPLASDHFTVDGTVNNDTYRIQSGPATGETTITGEFNGVGGAGFLLPTIIATGQSNSLIGTLNFNGVGGTDTLIVTGTNTSDVFNFFRASATSGSIDHDVNGVQTNFIGFANFAAITVEGLDGDDAFNVPGNFPTPLTVSGGNPSNGSDVLNVTASATVANLVTVDFAASTIGEATFPAQSFTGIETVNAINAGHNLTVLGTTGADSVTVDPTAAAAATIRLISSSPTISAPVVNASAIGTTFTVDLLAGSDNLRVNGTQAGETIAVTGTVVTVGALKTVTYAGTENLQVFGQAGSDTFNVTPSATTTMFIDGGDPIGTSGDTLNLTPPGAFTLQPGPEPDEGGMVGAGVQRVSWDHIEDVIVSGGGPGLVLGTNGDDDITIIARDSSTHAGTDGVQDFTVTVNDSFSALFINQPTLFVDALAGDDDIVVRAPAPNNAVWNVQITLTGGPAASPTGDQGDVLEFETPGGADAVIFTPTGPETGTLTLDQATDSVINFVSTFIFDPAGINYTSSPGGIEQIVYDGVSGAGGDTLTINGTVADEVLNYSSVAFGGTFRSNFTPTFDFSRTGSVTFNGGGGFDTANLGGSNGVDNVTSTGTAITMDSPGADIVLTIGTGVEKLAISTGDGNDTITLSLTVAGLAKLVDGGAGNDNINLSAVAVDPADPTIYGGEGDDIIVGSPNPDLIFGGAGNDLLRGAGGVDTIYGEAGNDTFGIVSGAAQDAGNDFFFGGEGSDLFIWNPGDGNDLFEGGAGESDRLQFQGSAAANTFVMNQVGTRLAFVFGAVILDVASTEDVLINALAGADTVTVNDLYATEVRHVTVDLTAGDVGDSVTVNGRDVSDVVNINAAAGIAAVTGLRYDVRVLNAVFADNDLLIFNGNDGNDNVVVNEATSALYAAANLQVNGGNGDDFVSGHGLLSGDAGNDTLIGGTASQALNGGTGNDVLNGLGGVDTMDGGAGEDLFYVNFDAATDNFIGGADYDTVLILGTSGNDVVAANQTAAGTIVSSLNGVNDTDSITTIERVRIEANSGDDIIFVQHLEALGTDAAVNSVLFDVDGGAAFTADRLVVQDNGASNVMIYRKSGIVGAGSMTVGPAVAEPLYTVFTGVEYVDPITTNPNNIFVFKYDPFEWNGNFQNATHLGAGNTLNADPVIDPGIPNVVLPPGFNNPPSDEDFYRIEAQKTGTLDVQVFFRQNVGLPGNGDIDINLLDAAGNVIANDLDVDDDARIRIPAVAGQIYYLRVFQGQAGALNTYSVTIINEVAPVPFDLELDDDPVNGTTNPPGQADNSDTGRSQNDNITYDNTPTIVFRVPDNELINDVPDNSPGQPGLPVDGDIISIPFQADTGNVATTAGFRVAVYRTENNTRVHVGYATSLGNGVYSFTFPAAIPDGSNFISARVEMVDPSLPHNQGFGAFATQDLEIFVDTVVPPVFFGQQSIATDGLHPNSDSGVLGPDPTNVATLSDRITNDTTPTFWGRSEANANIRAYLDVNGNGTVELATDIFLGFTTAVPYDGTNQMGNPTGNEPNGYWELTSVVNLDSQAVLTALGVPAGQTGGLRRILVTAEDVAGNITSGAAQVQLLNIFVDEQGPQVTGVEITGNPGFDLFDPKASSAGQTPTPLVNSLSIDVRDFPARLVPPPAGGPGTDYPALQETIAEIAAHYQVRGDYNGIIPIESVVFVADAPVNGQPATGTIIINFFKPLPDDRFTLTIQDDVVDPAGNRLDGEVNAPEPQEDPLFPSGDGVPGGDFVARFTVDSRPELGTWAAGSIWVDTNGNTIFDQDNLDFTNRDIAYLLGYTSDELFAGNFANNGVADGFDKLAAYGKVGAQWRWQIDTDNDGVPNVEKVDPAGINGFPVSGDFAPGLAGDEVGLFTGSTWYLDTNGDFNLQVGVKTLQWRLPNGTPVTGYGFTGDFDGDGTTDLATWTDDMFRLDLSGVSPGFLPDGIIDASFSFGFPGARERPVAHDMNQDGFDDIGLWTPDRTTQTPGDDAEWYFLVSGLVNNDTPGGGPAVLGPSIPERIVADPITAGRNIVKFTPEPFGNDLYMQYGDEFSLPILGNFDPPVVSSTLLPSTNHNNALDVNNDGRVSAFDALQVINKLNTVGGPSATPKSGFIRAPFLDVDGNAFVTAFDALQVINYLNLHPVSSGSGGEDTSMSAPEDIGGGEEELLTLLALDQNARRRENNQSHQK